MPFEQAVGEKLAVNEKRRTKIATWILRLIGGSVCLAFVPIFFPLGLMASIHALLGLGEIPDQPIFEYLARSLSAMYFAHGCLVLVISTDVPRYLPLVKLVALLNIFLGVLLLGIDLLSPMPWFWTLCEGPPIAGIGIILLVTVLPLANASSS